MSPPFEHIGTIHNVLPPVNAFLKYFFIRRITALTGGDTSGIIRRMKTFADIINLWPTAEELARDLGVTGLVVRAWRNRESIPAEYWTAIAEAARKRKIRGVTLELFAGLAARRGQL